MTLGSMAWLSKASSLTFVGRTSASAPSAANAAASGGFWVFMSSISKTLSETTSSGLRP